MHETNIEYFKKLLILVWDVIKFIWLCLIPPIFRLIWGFTTTDNDVIKRINKSFKNDNEFEIHYSRTDSKIKQYIENNLMQGMILELDGGSRYRIVQSENRHYSARQERAIH